MKETPLRRFLLAIMLRVAPTHPSSELHNKPSVTSQLQALSNRSSNKPTMADEAEIMRSHHPLHKMVLCCTSVEMTERVSSVPMRAGLELPS